MSDTETQSCTGGSEPSTCPDALEKLFEYLDGELEDHDAQSVAHHFEICRRCYPRLRFEQAFMEALRRVNAGEAAPRELRSRVLEVLHDEGLHSR